MNDIKRHELAIRIRKWDLISWLHLPKPVQPLIRDLGDLPFEIRKLLLHRERVVTILDQFGEAVEVLLCRYACGSGGENAVLVTAPHPKPARCISESAKMKLWHIVV
jgi:hypothetical protein